MYKNNLAMAVKVGGKVLREINDTVYLPFGSEYSISFKNTSITSRVKIRIKIDGQDIMDGAALIVNPNSSTDISRFVKNGNLQSGNSLKFIEKTDKISAHRGDRVEDGLITVEYEFEKYEPVAVPHVHTYDYPFSNGILRSYSSHSPIALLNTVNSAGITAPGSINEQKFNSTTWKGSRDNSKDSMTLQLKGQTENAPIVSEITVETKTECTMCGTKHKSGTKFCSECGTSLRIV